MKRIYMEPEAKVTRFEYEEIMTEIGGSNTPNTDGEFPGGDEFPED